MFRLGFVLLCLCVLSPVSLARTINWNGKAGNSLWNFANNWDSNAVPTASDDVVINALGGASVSISQPAAANSISIGGGQYAQTLNQLSSLAVGAGGVNVYSAGTLQIQSNNELPLSVTGSVTVQSGGSMLFVTGAITGPGQYTVNGGGSLTFSQSALKLITNTNVTIYGTTTIQGSTIELEKTANIVSTYGANITVVGGANIFNTDNSASGLVSYGGFDFQGAGTLTFQAPTFFYGDLNIDAGNVALQSYFLSNATINIPAGSTLTVGADSNPKYFSYIKGNGELLVSGAATLTQSISLSTIDVSDSGVLTVANDVAVVDVVVEGKLIVQTNFNVQNLTLNGGNMQGPGTTVVGSTLLINPSNSGTPNNFLSSTLRLFGSGVIAQPIYLLLGQGGQLHVANNATLEILNSVNFGISGGTPLVIIDGTVSVTLPTGGTITSNVNINGAGTLKMNSGTLTAMGVSITLGYLFLADGVLASLQTVTLTASTVSGAGSLNLTAAPSPVSTITNAPITYLGIVSGAVNIGAFQVDTFNVYGGSISITAGSTNTATNVNLYGGSIAGSTKITSSQINLNILLPVSLNAVQWKTGALVITEVGTGSLMVSNGATVISDASSVARSPFVRGVSIN